MSQSPDTAAKGSLAALATALESPACYPHPVDRVARLETHISVVLLAGDFAYKLKKPVDLGFLDFRTLSARRDFCEAEVRLNRRTAPGLYLDVVPITGTPAAPRVGGQGAAQEYAVRMRRFPQESLLDHLARAGLLQPAQVEALARNVARFHASAARAKAGSGFATPEVVLDIALDNFRQVESGEVPPGLRVALDEVRGWTLREHRAIAPHLARRLAGGFVRECHGDLHLGNLVLLDGAPVPFDCIEFNERLRWIDAMSDVAFATMDLVHHRLPALAARFLDTWVEESGDHDGLGVLRFYLVYRAMVRATVASIRARQSGKGATDADTRGHLALAKRLSARAPPALVLMHGLSGSGKTTVAQALVESLGAIRLRSDVERKRLHGLAPLARAEGELDEGLYTPGENERTYARLGGLALDVMKAGWPVVVDATFLQSAQREAFRAIAAAAGARFAIADCVAPEATLRQRIAARTASGRDASDAGLAVLERQLATAQPLTGAERAEAVTFETEDPAAQSAAIGALSRRLGIARAG
jgi:aminoglycoside phosphotransferase family enzyme/predicted kinase